MTLDDVFVSRDQARRIFDALQAAIGTLADVESRVTKSQIAFRRRRAFAWAWVPDRYLHGQHAPLVLSVSFRTRSTSPRWKEIVEPAPGRFMHHLELWSAWEIDDEVRGWLQQAWEAAG